MTLLETSDNFFVTAWNAIVVFFTEWIPIFFTEKLPDFIMNPADNWPWFIVVGAGIIVFVLLIVLLARAGKKRRRRKREKKEALRVASEAEKERNDEAVELERIRQAREAEVRANGLSVDDLIEKRKAEELEAEQLSIEQAELKLQEAFALEAESVEVDDAPAVSAFTDETSIMPEELRESNDNIAEVSETARVEEIVEEVKEEPIKAEPVEQPIIEPKAVKEEPSKPTAKKAAAAKTESKPTETVMYSIVYDRAAREWVVRKTGSPRAIRRLRTKAEALAYAEQLSVRQGLALQVHKKDGKFQKK